MRLVFKQVSTAKRFAIFSAVCFCTASSFVSIQSARAHDPIALNSTPSTFPATANDEADSETSSGPDVLPQNQRKENLTAADFQARKKIVFDFLDEHFAELRKSLLKSETRSPARYRNAVSRLEKDIVRLRNVEQRNPAKFDLMVDLWKLKTRTEITIAKYASKETDSQLEKRISPLVEEMLNTRIAIVELDRQTALKRLSNVDQRLLHLKEDRDRIIENNLRSLQKAAQRVRVKQKKKVRASVKTQLLNAPQPPRSKPQKR